MDNGRRMGADLLENFIDSLLLVSAEISGGIQLSLLQYQQNNHSLKALVSFLNLFLKGFVTGSGT